MVIEKGFMTSAGKMDGTRDYVSGISKTQKSKHRVFPYANRKSQKERKVEEKRVRE